MQLGVVVPLSCNVVVEFLVLFFANFPVVLSPDSSQYIQLLTVDVNWIVDEVGVFFDHILNVALTPELVTICFEMQSYRCPPLEIWCLDLFNLECSRTIG